MVGSGLLAYILLFGLVLQANGRRRYCFIPVSSSVFGYYNQDRSSWTIQLNWIGGYNPTCNILLQKGISNTGKFTTLERKICQENSICKFNDVPITCEDIEEETDFKFIMKCRNVCFGTPSSGTFTTKRFIKKGRECNTVYSKGAQKTTRNDPEYIQQLQYFACSEEKSCSGPTTYRGPGCYCKDGFLQVNGTCVPRQQCPENSPIFDPLNLKSITTCTSDGSTPKIMTFSWIYKEHHHYKCTLEDRTGDIIRSNCGEHEHEGKMYIPTGGLPVGFYRLNISDDSTGKEESLQFAVDKVYTEPFWMSARATTSGAVICFTSTEIRKYKCSIGNNGHIDNKYDCESCQNVTVQNGTVIFSVYGKMMDKHMADLTVSIRV